MTAAASFDVVVPTLGRPSLSTLLDAGKVEVVTGVNLPMLIKLAQVEAGQSLASVARLVGETGQKNIYIASDLLAPKKEP